MLDWKAKKRSVIVQVHSFAQKMEEEDEYDPWVEQCHDTPEWYELHPFWKVKRFEAIRPHLHMWICLLPLQNIILEYQTDIWRNENTCFIAQTPQERMDLLDPMLKPEVVTLLFTSQVETWQDWIQKDPKKRSLIQWGTKLPLGPF